MRGQTTESHLKCYRARERQRCEICAAAEGIVNGRNGLSLPCLLRAKKMFGHLR